MTCLITITPSQAAVLSGTGSNVTWDLTGVPPGTYTITAKVDDSCGICGKTMTKGVMIIGKTPIVACCTGNACRNQTRDPSNDGRAELLRKPQLPL